MRINGTSAHPNHNNKASLVFPFRQMFIPILAWSLVAANGVRWRCVPTENHNPPESHLHHKIYTCSSVWSSLERGHMHFGNISTTFFLASLFVAHFRSNFHEYQMARSAYARVSIFLNSLEFRYSWERKKSFAIRNSWTFFFVTRNKQMKWYLWKFSGNFFQFTWIGKLNLDSIKRKRLKQVIWIDLCNEF